MIKKLIGHRLFKNTLALAFLQLANYIAPLAVLPFLSRILSIQEFGMVAITLSVIQLSQIVTDYGFTYYAAYEVSVNRENKKYINWLVGNIFSAKIILIFFVFLLINLFLMLNPYYATYSSHFYVGMLAVIAQAYQPMWLFQGLEKMKNVTVYTIGSKLAYVVLVYLLIKKAEDGIWVIIAWSIAQFVGMAISLYEIKKENISIKLGSIKGAIKMLRLAQGFFWARLSSAMYSPANSLIIGWLYGPIQSAYYSASEQIYKVCVFAPFPITQSLYPYMTKEKNWRVFFGIILCMLIPISIGSFGVFLYAKEIVVMLFGVKYESSYYVVRCFMLAVPLNYLSSNLGYPLLGALGRANLANIPIIAGAILYLFFVMFIYYYKVGDAAWIAGGVAGVEAIVVIMNVSFAVYIFKSKASL